MSQPQDLLELEKKLLEKEDKIEREKETVEKDKSAVKKLQEEYREKLQKVSGLFTLFDNTSYRLYFYAFCFSKKYLLCFFCGEA